MRNTHNSGFTLIELLVVVIIVSILTIMGVQMISSGSVERNLQQHGRVLQSSIEFSCDQAILQNVPYGLLVSQTAYGFVMFVNQNWQEVIYQDDSLGKIFTDGSQISLILDGQEVSLEEELSEIPQVICDITGEISPFVITISDTSEQHYFQLKTLDFGEIKGQWLDEKL